MGAPFSGPVLPFVVFAATAYRQVHAAIPTTGLHSRRLSEPLRSSLHDAMPTL